MSFSRILAELGPRTGLFGVFLAILISFSAQYPEASLGRRIDNSCSTAQRWAALKLGRPVPDFALGDALLGDDRGLHELAKPFYYFVPRLIGNPSPPKGFLFFLTALWWGGMVLAYREFSRAFGPTVGEGAVIACVLSSPFRFVALGADVYLFPFFAAVLAVAALNRIQDKNWRPAFAFAGGILACEIIRSGSWFVAGVFAAVAAAPTLVRKDPAKIWRRRAAALFIGVFLLVGVHKATGRRAHGTWHSLYAGLMEFGGWVSADKKTIYPAFVPPVEVPASAVWRPSWNDWIEYDLVSARAPGVARQTLEYDRILREDFLRIASRWPVGLAGHFLRRAYNLLNLDLWSWTFKERDKGREGAFGVLARALFLSTAVFGLLWDGRRARLALCFAATLSVPGLLVYSSSSIYVIGTWPFLVVASLLGLRALALRAAERFEAPALGKLVSLKPRRATRK